MSLISLRNIALSYGGLPLFAGLNLQIEPGERVCLVGRNGEGKSSLMKVMAGEIEPDRGEIIAQRGLVVARLGQEVPVNLDGSVFDLVASGLTGIFELLAACHRAEQRLETDHSPPALAELNRAQQALEAADGWQARRMVETTISRLSLPADQAFAQLSGGLKRRVLLARALVSRPDLLLLDEPTNHLDIEAINWLEDFLLSYPGAVFFVTHDRMLLARIASRIVELDRGRLTSWPGNYQTFLRRKEEELAVEESQQRKFGKKLAQEEAWIRQGIKARRTRNEGRVRKLIALRKEHAAHRRQIGTVRLNLQDAGLSGKLVVELHNVSFGYKDRPIITGLSTTIMRGDRVGIIGPNGVGKSTLLKLLLGQLAPEEGTIRMGTRLEPCYFDQNREQLDLDKSVADNVADGKDTVVINGMPRHIIGYLQDFLFAPTRARQPARVLSGGEKNRLLLARLFTMPFNLLILDEPTNDLDVETLELLEELLLDYQGTLLLVSHDRAFLNNVVTSTLVFEGEGRVVEYAGGYDDWLSQRQIAEPEAKKPEKPRSAAPQGKVKPVIKLSYREERELEGLPERIEKLEEEQEDLHRKMANPEQFAGDISAIGKAGERLHRLEQELEAAYARWEELEAKRQGEG